MSRCEHTGKNTDGTPWNSTAEKRIPPSPIPRTFYYIYFVRKKPQSGHDVNLKYRLYGPSIIFYVIHYIAVVFSDENTYTKNYFIRCRRETYWRSLFP